MSVAEILSPVPNAWANLTVSSVTLNSGLDVNSVPAPLNWYETFSATGATYSGATTGAAVYKITRVGNIVSLRLPGVVGAGAAATLTTSAAIPARFRPAANLFFRTMVYDNSAVVAAGVLEISTAGVISAGIAVTNAPGSETLTAFTASGNAGLYGTTVSWNIA